MRLKPFTDTAPKVMALVKGKPFLEHLLRYIRSFSIKDILLLTGYLGKQIEVYFGNGEQLGLSIEYVNEAKPLGTGGALKNAEDKLRGEFLLFNGDTYLPIDYKEVIESFQRRAASCMIVAHNNSDKIFVNNMRVGEDSRVLAYSKTDTQAMTEVDAGLTLFKREAIDYIPEKKPCSFEREALPRLIEKGYVSAFITGQRFYDMGTPGGLKDMEDIL